MLTKHADPGHKQKAIYSLTEASIQLIPVMAALGSWGLRWLPVTDDLAVRAQLLEEGGPELHERFMVELRDEHLGIPVEPTPDGKCVRERLHEACLAMTVWA